MKRKHGKMTGIALAAIMAAAALAGCGSKKLRKRRKSQKQNTEESSDASKDAADTEKADQDTADSGELKGSGETLVVGVQPCSFCYPVIYASEKGYFKDAGLDVEYIVFDKRFIHERGPGSTAAGYRSQRPGNDLYGLRRRL